MLIADESLDVSSSELAICLILWVDSNLETHEKFIELCPLFQIGRKHIFDSCRDVLLGLELNISRGKRLRNDNVAMLMEVKMGLQRNFRSSLQKCLLFVVMGTAQKMNFSITHFFSKCDQLRIWSHLLKKSLMENLIFCAVGHILNLSIADAIDKIKPVKNT